MNQQQIKEKADALGFDLEKGEMKFAGYVIVHRDSGRKPLGDRYTASLREVQTYLERYAEDNTSIVVDESDDEEESGILSSIEADVNKKPRVQPPSRSAKLESLHGHTDAAKIKDIALKSERVPETPEARRNRLQIDHFLNLTRHNLDLLPEAERAKLLEASRKAHEEEERLKAANLPKRGIRPGDVRNDKITIDDPNLREKVRQNNVFKKADRQFSRTNQSSKGDLKLGSDGFAEKPHLTEAERYFLKPDADSADHQEVKPADVNAEQMKGRLSRAELLRRRSLQALELRFKAARAEGKSGAELGRILLEAKKNLVEHGRLQGWLMDLGISDRTARDWMDKAKKIQP
jgi:hypothetical protein